MLKLDSYTCLGAALRDALDRWPNETCLIEADRDKETVQRWEAGYDLAIGRVLAVKVRTETYNAMLAAAKRGLKLSDPKNNTFDLKPADDLSVGETAEDQVALARAAMPGTEQQPLAANFRW